MTRNQLLRSLVCSHEGACNRIYALANGDEDKIRSIMCSPTRLFAVLKGASRCTYRELNFTLSKAPDMGDSLATNEDVRTIMTRGALRR